MNYNYVQNNVYIDDMYAEKIRVSDLYVIISYKEIKLEFEIELLELKIKQARESATRPIDYRYDDEKKELLRWGDILVSLRS
jgi:hypothetical protein